MQRIRHAHRHWVGAPTWGQLLDASHHWHRYRDPHAAELLLQTISHQLQEAQQQANEETSLQHKQWLQEGYHKGLKGLFRSLKSSELAWERPYRLTPMPQRMDQRLADWGGDKIITPHRGPVYNKQRSSRQKPFDTRDAPQSPEGFTRSS